MHYTNFDHIFFDLDHTLWDFETNSERCLQQLMIDFQLAEKYNLTHEKFYKKYVKLNHFYWELYSQNKIDKEELRYIRFYKALIQFGIDDMSLSKEIAVAYTRECPKLGALINGAKEVVELLVANGKEINLITNGFKEIQHIKLASCGLDKYVTRMITSEQVGHQKPHKKTFQYAMDQVGCNEATSCLMIGDNWRADVQGARDFGMSAIWISKEDMKDSTVMQMPDLMPLYKMWQ